MFTDQPLKSASKSPQGGWSFFGVLMFGVGSTLLGCVGGLVFFWLGGMERQGSPF